MEEVKLKINGNQCSIEGEFDIEFDLSCMHVGFPEEDKDVFNKTSFEIKSYGEINLKYLTRIVKWINRNNTIPSSEKEKWPKWKITFERL